MTLALTVTDNATTPTGATATVSGSGGGTNTVFTQLADGNLRTPGWISQGSCSGDGTVALTLQKGIYWAYCQNVNGGVTSISNIFYFGVTDGLTALQEQIHAAVISRCQQLTFAGIAASPAPLLSTSIYDKLVALELLQAFPCLMVILEDLAETIKVVVNARDDYGYPVNIGLVDRNDSGDYKTPRPKYLMWRQQLERAFSNQRLGGVPDIYTCVVTPAAAVSSKLIGSNYYQSWMTCRFFCREPRGLS